MDIHFEYIKNIENFLFHQVSAEQNTGHSLEVVSGMIHDTISVYESRVQVFFSSVNLCSVY